MNIFYTYSDCIIYARLLQEFHLSYYYELT